jgi:hypothetical protein
MATNHSGGTEHWMERRIRLNLPINPVGFVNNPRMSAETIRRMIAWRNQMNMVKRPLIEDHQIYEEQNAQTL